jgi:hypothetical protein
MAGDQAQTAEYECDRELSKHGNAWEVKKK